MKNHPEWFTTRADGTIAYAENPPKKYQDIYPINFDNDPTGIYGEVLRIVRHWMAHGVRIFRVDNPHTKPVAFWEWLLGEVRRTDPDVHLPLRGVHPAGDDARARHGRLPPVLHVLHLAHRASWEIEEYLRRAVARDRPPDAAELLREHPRHPPRLPAVRRPGGVQDPRRARRDSVAELGRLRRLRAVRARRRQARAARSTSTPRSTRSGSGTGTPRPPRAAPSRRTSPGSTRSAASTPRCSSCATSHIHGADDENVLVFSKTAGPDHASDEGDDTLIVVINLDPHGTRETTVHLDMPALGFDWHDSFVVHDEITGESWTWGEHNYVRLDPHHEPAHVLTRQEAPVTEATATEAFPDHPETPGPDVIGEQPRLVQDGGLLRGPGALVPGHQRRRHRRLPRAHREARLPPVARRRLPVGAAVLHLAAARRRLRRRRLHQHPPGVRDRRATSTTSSTRRTSAASA